MKTLTKVLTGLLLSSTMLISSCQRSGCMDPLSNDYDVDAKMDDGSCTYNYGGKDYGQIDVGSVVLNEQYNVYIDGEFIGLLLYYFPSGLSCANPNAVGRVYPSGSYIVRAESNGGTDIRQGTVYLDPQECLVVLIENLQIIGGGGGDGYNCVSGSCGYVGSNADYASLAACQNACGGGSCPYNQYSGTDNCDPGYNPVTSSLCCPDDSPYYCSETNSCYTTCESADAACTSVSAVKSDATGGGGGSAGYNCVSGNCGYVSSGADYATLAACEAACGGGGPIELVNTTMSGGTMDRQYIYFTVPSGVTFMEVKTQETPPDAAYNLTDLFVNFGSYPVCDQDPFISYNADCASYNVNRQQDICNFTNPQAGTWYVMTYNWSGSHYECNLVVTITY